MLLSKATPQGVWCLPLLVSKMFPLQTFVPWPLGYHFIPSSKIACLEAAQVSHSMALQCSSIFFLIVPFFRLAFQEVLGMVWDSSQQPTQWVWLRLVVLHRYLLSSHHSPVCGCSFLPVAAFGAPFKSYLFIYVLYSKFFCGVPVMQTVIAQWAKAKWWTWGLSVPS